MGEKKSKNLPDHAIVITTYAELEQYARAFAEGYINLLIVLGRPGVGKSRALRRALSTSAYWMDGNVSGFGIYIGAYEHRDEPLVLDDPGGLYRDRNGIRLLKALCQSEPIKTLGWHTDARTLERRGIPHEFSTTSRVVIIANQWKTLNLDVVALEDRGHVVVFEPSSREVHLQASTWFWDQEIFDFVAEHLHLIEEHSLRTYVLAWELKQARLDWKAMVLGRCLSGKALLVATLKADTGFATEEERARAFDEGGHGCRATYFKYAKKLAASEPVPTITLTVSGPPTVPRPEEDPPACSESDSDDSETA